MSNFKSLKEEKVYVLYKDNPFPARVISVEKRGKNHYLLVRWENFGGTGFKPEKWVKDTLCKEYKPTGKKTLYQELYGNAARKLNWFQKLIVKLQNWWYSGD